MKVDYNNYYMADARTWDVGVGGEIACTGLLW
jgi:hypothetical protein